MSSINLTNNTNNITNISNNQINRENNSNKITKTNDTFMKILESGIKEVNNQELKANKLVQQLAAGQNDNIAGTMIALEKADISMRLLIQVRNKVINAYQEIMRIQL